MHIYEQKIIGGILAGLIAASVVSLDPTDFQDAGFGRVLAIAKQLEAEQIKIDVEIVYSRLMEMEASLTLGDISFLSVKDLNRIAQSVKSTAVVFEAVDKVKAAALKTFLLEQTAHLSGQEEKTAAELLDCLRETVVKADKYYQTSENNFVFLKDLAPKVAGVYQDLHAGISYAVPTYFPQIDEEILDGFSKGDLHIICGFTGNGKSALALNFARNQAQEGFCVGVVSREMSDIENVMRLQAADAGVPRWKIRKDMWDSTFTSLLNHLQTFQHLPIAFDTRTTDVESLRSQVNRMCEEFEMKILYVDYLQLMKSNDKSTRANEVQKVSHELKEIAMSNKIPVVALCQFSREAKNASLFELLACLKESGAIEQDASTVLYVQIEKTEERKEVKEGKLTVLKNRNGVCFSDNKLNYKGAEFQFYE